MITPATEILNQKGTPMFNSDLFANRPAAGIAGRIFISTDTKELYRDTGTTWELLSAGSGGTITGSGAATQVAFWNGSSSISGSSNLFWDSTNNRLGINTATPGVALDVHGTNVIAQLNGITNSNAQLSLQSNGTNKWQVGNIYSGGSNYFRIQDNASNVERVKIENSGLFTYTGSISVSSSVTASSHITTGGTASQFVKGNGSLDSTAYQPLLTNPVTGTGAATQVAFWNSGSGITGNNNLWWDNTNSFLGVKTNSPISELDVVGQGYFHPSVTASTGAGWASSYALTTATIPSTTFSNLGNVFCGATGINNMTYNGSSSFSQANVPAAVIGNNIFKFGAAGYTITLDQGSGLRAFSALNAFNQVQSSFVGTISHLAGVHVLSPYASNQLMNVTNYYGLLINNATERTAFTITNRWGVYQDGALDRNYFNGNVLIKSNVDNGNALQVTGAATFSGNVGIGVTPSAWLSSQRALEVSGWSINAASVTSTLATNAFVNDSSQWIYKSNGFATRYDNVSGQHQWYISPSGTAGNAITFTQAMTLDASGRLGIGTTSPDARLRVSGLFNGTQAIFGVVDGRGLEIATALTAGTNDAASVLNARGAGSGTLIFQTEGSERMRITSSGNVGIGTASPNAKLHLVSVSSAGNSLPTNASAIFEQSGNNVVSISGGTTDEAGFWFARSTSAYYSGIYRANDSLIFRNNDTERMRITSGGNVLIGSATDTGNKLYLNGSLRIDGQRSGTSSGNSGQHLIIVCDGITYKIALLNP